jgi:hypothetical protein
VTADYAAFGLVLRSNLPIPGLTALDSQAAQPDIEVHLGIAPPFVSATGGDLGPIYVSAITTEAGEPALRMWKTAEGLLRMDYFDGARFWFDEAGTTIWATWPETLLLEDAATYLLGPVLGWVLRRRGVTCLHASAVVVGGYAAAFVGCAGAGKSTTAAALARRGHAVITDDIVALVEKNAAFVAAPAYPYLCLRTDAVKLLYGSEEALPAFSPSWDKRRLQLADNRLGFEERALPLGPVFLLGERSAEPEAPFIEEVPPKDALLALVVNSYAKNLLDREMRKSEFETLGRLVNHVPVWRLRSHRDSSRIEALCDLIEKACEDVSARGSQAISDSLR